MPEKEKRRYKRMNVDLKLNISKLFHQDNEVIANIDAPIEVTDISKGGIGFTSSATLPTGYYFNAKIKLGGDDSILYTVVRIVRSRLCDNGLKNYGAEFVGLAPILNYTVSYTHLTLPTTPYV